MGAVFLGANCSRANYVGNKSSERQFSSREVSRGILSGGNYRQVNCLGAIIQGAIVRGAIIRGLILLGWNRPDTEFKIKYSEHISFLKKESKWKRIKMKYNNLTGNYMFKVNKRNTRTSCEIAVVLVSLLLCYVYFILIWLNSSSTTKWSNYCQINYYYYNILRSKNYI